MSLANPINAPAGGLKPECWKRKGSEEEDENLKSTVKKARYSWHVILESESPQRTSSDEDDESIHSIQGVETEFAHDTEDTSSTNTWVTSSDDAEVSIHEEFDPVSPSEDENPFVDDSSSDPEELLRAGMIAVLAHAACDSDVGLADDSDDSRTSRDSEISLADYWTCFQCNTSNNNPKFRYCDKCYTERKNHLPLRPKGKKQRGKLSKISATPSQTLKSQEITAFDSGLGSSLGSQRSLNFDFKTADFERPAQSQSSSLKALEITASDSGLGLSQGSQRSLNFDFKSIDLEKPAQSQSSSSNELEITAGDSGLGSSQESQLSVGSDFKGIEITSTSDLSLASSQPLLQSSQESVDTVDAAFLSSQPSTSFESQPSSQEPPTIDSSGPGNRLADKTSEDAELRSASQESTLSLASTASVGSRDLTNWDSGDESGLVAKIVASTKRVRYQIESENNLCMICTVGPRNGIFVHGRITHICCCYRCAKRVWKTTKHCPICNRRVRDVLKAYYA